MIVRNIIDSKASSQIITMKPTDTVRARSRCWRRSGSAP